MQHVGSDHGAQLGVYSADKHRLLCKVLENPFPDCAFAVDKAVVKP